MTFFTIPPFSRRPSFALSLAHPTNTVSERIVEEKPLYVASRTKEKVNISGPRVLNSSPVSPASHQSPTPSKRQAPRRVTRSRSRSQLMVPNKATATQTLTLTSALSISSQTKDTEDVDINTISSPSLPSLLRSRPSLTTRNFSPSAPNDPSSPTPPPSKTLSRGIPPQPGMGRGRGLVTARAGHPSTNPKIRTSTSPPSAGTPPIQKRARLTSLSQSSNEQFEDRENEMNIPVRPESPTPGSEPSLGFTLPRKPVEVIRRKPTPFRPPTSVSMPQPTKKVWDAISPSPLSGASPPASPSLPPLSSPDDDDDIIVLRMDVVEKEPAPVMLGASTEMNAGACNPPIGVDSIGLSTSFTQCNQPNFEDVRDEMLRLSTVLAKRVRKRIYPSLSDDVPPPIPSPIKLRQAIATMFLEHGNSFPPLRRRSPPGLGGAGKQRSRLNVGFTVEEVR